MNILESLKGGDLRSIGNADKLAQIIREDQEKFDQVFNGIFSQDPLIRMRAADAVEKASKINHRLLQKHKVTLLQNLDKIEQQEVRWHVAQLISYLTLTDQEVAKVTKTLKIWIKTDESRIVKVNSIQALADISASHPKIKAETVQLINELIKTGIPSLVSRGKKLLKRLEI